MGVVRCGGHVVDAGGGVAGLRRIDDGGGGCVVALSMEVVGWWSHR